MNYVFRRHANRVSPGQSSLRDGLQTTAPALVMPFACAADVPCLVDSFGKAANALGFPYYVISRVARGRSTALPRTALEMICGHYPDDWVRHYQRLGYASTDPVHRVAFTRSVPYRWNDITGLTRAERRVLGEASDAGLPGGLSIPVHQPGGSVLLFNLSGPLHFVNAAVNCRQAYFISTQFHFELQRLTQTRSRKPSSHLSPRQCECLTWVARGKTSWEISVILGLSQHTVDYHIGEAMVRLDVNSRTAAAVNAIVQGLVEV